jgi:hypothetical protein
MNLSVKELDLPFYRSRKESQAMSELTYNG